MNNLSLLFYNCHLFPPWMNWLEYLSSIPITYKDEMRTEIIANKLTELDSDIIILAEVWHHPFVEKIINKVYETHPYNYNPNIGMNLFEGKIVGTGMLLLSKYPIENPSFEVYRYLVDYDSYSHKGYIKAFIKHPIETICVYGTHVQADHGTAPHSAIKESNICQLFNDIKDEQEKNVKLPILVMGDMNIEMHKPEYLALLSAIKTHNMLDAAGDKPNYTMYIGNTLQQKFTDKPGNMRLDYMFYDRDHFRLNDFASPTNFRTDEREDLSDHEPIYGNFTIIKV